MTSETQRKIDAVFIAINALRRRGLIPMDACISPRGMAWVSQQIEEPVSASTFRRIEKTTQLKAQLAIEAMASKTNPPH